METPNHQKLLFISLFSLVTFNFAHAICVPRNSSKSHASPSPFSSPISQPAASPGPEAVRFDSPDTNLPPLTAPQPASKPSFESAFSGLSSSMLRSGPGSAHDDSAAIKKICASTDFPAICLSAITPSLNGKTDTISVLKIAINAATEQTKLAVAAATKLASSPGIDSQLASILSDCKDSYVDALDNYQKAMEALPARDIGTMNSMLSAAITDFSDCDDFLSGQSSPLLDFNPKLSQMTSNCLAIVSLIQ